MLPPLVRFHKLIRDGLRFRKKLDAIKQEHPQIAWYPYDSFASLFQLPALLKASDATLDTLAGGGPLLDIGAGDGALAFYFESLGHEVSAIDNSGTNINRMLGIHTLASELGSRVRILDADLDSGFEIPGEYNLALMLGVLYHLRNPFFVLERVARAARYCFLSTRIARLTPDHALNLDGHPLAYLLGEGEANNDSTNYWIFSPAGLERLVSRCGWNIMAKSCVGDSVSDPAHSDHDERMFVLMKSRARS